MTASSRPRIAAWRRLLLAGLALAFLATGFAGQTGMQVLDRALSERLLALHLHGAPGERAYVEAHGVPAPFVAGHCHPPFVQSPSQTGPDEVQAASTLAGAILCPALALIPQLSALHHFPAFSSARFIRDHTLAPPIRPPRGALAGSTLNRSRHRVITGYLAR